MPPRPKVKASGGVPQKMSSARRLEDRSRKEIAHGHDVAMHVHRSLGLAGGARGEGDQCDVVLGGVAGRKFGRTLCADCFQRAAPRGSAVTVVEVEHLLQRAARLGLDQFVLEADVAKGSRDMRLFKDRVQLPGSQQRHGRHGDQAGLEDSQEAGGHHGIVCPAKQHPIARDKTHVVSQHVGDAIDLGLQLLVAALGIVSPENSPIAVPLLDIPVEQFHCRIQAVRVTDFRPLEQELGLQILARQMVARKQVEVASSEHRCYPPDFKSSLAMISFWTSVAPS